jgi:transcriptional regulator with XRE-family HTH domain
MTPSSVLTDRRRQINEFLKTRRAKVKPGDVGFPEHGRRNTPGLRREEVAVLAGVSFSWYTCLEQGRDVRVSASVLDAIASALALDGVERTHLYNLADMHPPTIETPSTNSERQMLIRFARDFRSPAFVVDKYWNILYVNPAAARVLRLTEGARTFLEVFFFDDQYREIFVNWGEVAECFVGSLRVHAGIAPDDPKLLGLLGSLSRNATFSTLWKKHSTARRKAREVTLRIDGGGTQTFDTASLDLSGCDDIHLISYIPQDGSAPRL